LPSSSDARSRARWTGVPAEDRRAERRTLLLDAAFELLGTEGWPGTTVRAVCQRARLNPRYFYESFPTLDDLVIAVYDRVVDELTTGVLAAVSRADDEPRAQLRAAIEHIVDFVDHDRRRARVLYVEALGSEALNRHRVETGHSLVEVVERVATARHGPPASGEQIGRLGAAILVGGLGELLLTWLDGRVDMTRDRLVDDTTALFLALGDAAAGIAAGRRRSVSGAGSRRRTADTQGVLGC
jgi:AcrR family transcriptional regulator